MDSEHEDSLRGVSLSILIEFKSNYGDSMFNASKQMTIKTKRCLKKIKHFDFADEIKYFKPYDGDIRYSKSLFHFYLRGLMH